jgi:uncharacterized protein
MLVALGLGWWWDAPPFARLEWTVGGLVAGSAATAPLLVGLWWCLRSTWRPMVRLIELVDERIGPLFAGATWPELVLVSFMAGVGEEALFRGVVQETLARSVSDWTAILLAALLFGAAHWVSLAYAVLAAVVGVYLGTLYQVTDGLLAPILAHSLYDLVALLVLTRLKPASAPTVV